MNGITYPPVGGSSGNTSIDDSKISSTTTWSSAKVHNEFISLMSEYPTLSLPSSANENTNVTITITNYKENTQYFFASDAGDIAVSGGTATLTTKEVDSDTSFTVSCYAVEAGKTRSDTATADITVMDVPVVADGSINNSDFQANEDTNDGFEY